MKTVLMSIATCIFSLLFIVIKVFRNGQNYGQSLAEKQQYQDMQDAYELKDEIIQNVDHLHDHAVRDSLARWVRDDNKK